MEHLIWEEVGMISIKTFLQNLSGHEPSRPDLVLATVLDEARGWTRDLQ